MTSFSSNLMLQTQFLTPSTRHALQHTLEVKTEVDINDPYQTVLLVLEAQSEDPTREVGTGLSQGSKAIAYAKWSYPVPAGEAYVEPSWNWPEGTDFEMEKSAQAGVLIYLESTLEATDFYKKAGFKKRDRAL